MDNDSIHCPGCGDTLFFEIGLNGVVYQWCNDCLYYNEVCKINAEEKQNVTNRQRIYEG